MAHVILSDLQILILDEMTANIGILGARCDQRITTFVIVHRLSTIRNSDTIIIIGNSVIIEQRNRARLMGFDDAYFGLIYQQQTRVLHR